ncbi:arginine N-succinyltransferase [Bdellovibrionales bacterium]|nr:arginine N-succinyltransferase [Bdellovibrionales bacterium]
MTFLVRRARQGDVDSIYNIAKQFSLLNLPADKSKITKKVEVSTLSFAGRSSRDLAQYVFVVEEVETGRVVGCSQLVAKHGTERDPNYSIQVIKKERFSDDLGVGFIHQILRLKMNEDGPTEIAGLVVDQAFRGRPEKVGRLLSLARFLYIGLNPERFEEELFAEMAPPHSEDGRSDFWEAYGRRFTGMSYVEANALSHENKGFIRSLFPEEDIYLCLLDAKARLAVGRVGEATRPALHLLEKQGFKYLNEVDPFDGGPHIVAKRDEIPLISKGKRLIVGAPGRRGFVGYFFISIDRGSEFLAGETAAILDGEQIFLPDRSMRALQLQQGDSIFVSSIE